MKNSRLTIKNRLWAKHIAILIITLIASFVIVSCKKMCGYTNTDNVVTPHGGQGCKDTTYLNLSTGVTPRGTLAIPGKGVTDPFWKLLNVPPLVSCSNTLASTINGSAYIVNYLGSGSSGWVNQPGASTICPVDLGTTDAFGCNNATNDSNKVVPYVFERSFCVKKNTVVDLNFTYKGDDQVYFQLINNNTGAVISTSSVYIFPGALGIWTVTGLPLVAGSYSIRAYLTNTSNVVLGFSFAGGINTTQGDASISDNVKGCCENNTISILNILEDQCNGVFDPGERVGGNWIFKLKNSSNVVIKTAATDINGNLFFSGLADGTYTIESVPVAPYLPSTPSSGSITVSVANNSVKILNFFNCIK